MYYNVKKVMKKKKLNFNELLEKLITGGDSNIEKIDTANNFFNLKYELINAIRKPKEKIKVAKKKECPDENLLAGYYDNTLSGRDQQ